MTNLSIKDIKNLGISEGEINEYVRNGIWHLALRVVEWNEYSIEFTKDKETDKLYPKETPEVVNLIRQLEQEKNFDVGKVKKELEKRFKEKEEKRPRFRECNGLRKPKFLMY